MPGIVGFLNNIDKKDNQQLLDTMIQSMMHENFYKKASHIDYDRGWYCGSVAFDGSYADFGPFFNDARDIALLLTGECFCDRNTNTAFSGNGYYLDPKYILVLYEKEGPGFVKHLNGWFSGIILDARNETVLIFTDRYSIQKVYYHYDNNGTLAFSSEIKALLKAFPNLKNIDMKNIAEYFCYDCVLENRTYFKNINVLPGGTSLSFSYGKIAQRCYFDPVDFENKPSMKKEEFFDQLSTTFESVVQRYTSGNKLAIALTGGLDTRLIMSCLPQDCSSITTFTNGGMYRDSNDVRLAKKLTQSCGLSHNVVRLDSMFLSEYSKHALRGIYISDGLANATTLDSVFLSNSARKIAPIKVMGTYGSQILGRVKRALRYRLPNPELINESFKPYIEESSKVLHPFQQEHDLTYILKREIPWFWSRFSVPQMSQMDIRHPFLDNDVIDILFHAPKEGYDGSQFEISAISKFKPSLLDIRTNKGFVKSKRPLVNTAIQKFIQFRSLAEKTLNWDILPYSLHHTISKLDSMFLSPLHLNKTVLGVEYYTHYNLWFRRELANYIKEILFDQRTLSRPYWNAQFIKEMVKDHINGSKRYLAEIRKVLTIELIHRVFIDGDYEY